MKFNSVFADDPIKKVLVCHVHYEDSRCFKLLFSLTNNYSFDRVVILQLVDQVEDIF